MRSRSSGTPPTSTSRASRALSLGRGISPKTRVGWRRIYFTPPFRRPKGRLDQEDAPPEEHLCRLTEIARKHLVHKTFHTGAATEAVESDERLKAAPQRPIHIHLTARGF